MGHGKRQWYEVRIRIQAGPDKWTKKSRFYEATNEGDAAGKYNGPGNIMWCRKKGRERLLDIGEFFRLGDSLLKELNSNGKGEGGSLLEQVQKEKDRTRKKRYFNSRTKIKERGL